MKISVYNQEGKETGQMLLPKEIFDVKLNTDLVHQVFVSQMSNMRQNSAHSKNRSEVRGGGKKPWRQKGTGRARHGSIRSPIWVGGGVSGGPRNERNYEKTIPAKIRRKALSMALSQKARENLLVVLENFESDGKTKAMVSMIKKLPTAAASRLVLYSDGNKKVYMAARNIAKTGVSEARNLNIVDLLNYKYVVIAKDGIAEIEKTLSSKK